MKKSAINGAQSRKDNSFLIYGIALAKLVISIILLILAYKINSNNLVSVLILVIAFIIAASDLIADAVNAIRKKDFFNNTCLILIAAIAAFAVGCYIEAIVFVAVFRLFSILHSHAVRITKKSLSAQFPNAEEGQYNKLSNILNHPESIENTYKNQAEPIAKLVVMVASVIAVLFAVIMPLVSDMTYIMSVRRGAMLIVAVVPVSMFASLPFCNAFGMCYSAIYGIFTERAEPFEKAANVKAVVFDKADVITGGVPKISAIISPVLDKQSFLKSAAYIAYKSEQRIAAPIISAYNGEVYSEYIEEFSDILGCGMEITIAGQSMLLGTLDLLESRGVVLDEKDIHSGYVFYLIISGKYAGCIIFSENINPYAEKTVSDLKRIGIKSYLCTEDGREVSERIAESLGVSDYSSCCDTNQKLEILSKIKSEAGEDEALMYVSAENLDYHTVADIDAKVGNLSDIQDIQLSNIGIYGLPVTILSAKKARKVSAENILLSTAVKLVLVALALTGNATLWFIATLDYAAGIFGILNISTISKK